MALRLQSLQKDAEEFETAMQEIKRNEDMLFVGGSLAILAAIGCVAYAFMKKEK